MASSPSSAARLQFGRSLRERFLADVSKGLVGLGAAVQVHLTELLDEPTSSREAQPRRDTWMAYKDAQQVWTKRTIAAWHSCLDPLEPKKPVAVPHTSALSLVGTDEVEKKILASRLVRAVRDKVAEALDDLRVRIKYLEGIEDLAERDVFLPDVLLTMLVEQWPNAGMSPESWAYVGDVVQRGMVTVLLDAYQTANTSLIDKGVLPVIELKDRVKAPKPMGSAPQRQVPRVPDNLPEMGGVGDSVGPPSTQMGSSVTGHAPATPYAANHVPAGQPSGHSGRDALRGHAASASSGSPLARAKARAQGVLGQLKRMFISHADVDFERTELHRPSSALQDAISPQVLAVRYAEGGTLFEDYSSAGVARVAGDLRERTAQLKQKAATKGEKATIEIVALMFQAILTEERIPPGVRVWFARLQMPVLRVALEDTDFFSNTDHPARQLIDRMGSCVMGFDGTGVQSAAMEKEVKRIVQVVEQYPETGKKVYQIVYEEFQKFLSMFLTNEGVAQKVMSVAQQVEQKETLAIQYTIDMRDMLKDMPVRDEIRNFLFKVWAEVMAVSALRKGAKHADTQALKKSATDLVWAASAKPNRADRARVIQDLPGLLLRLRAGMTLLAMPPSEQEGHIKKISDTLADAFLSKTQAIPQANIDAMAQRLSDLEDFVGDDFAAELPLDSESLEMMLGIEAASIELVSGGGTQPTAAMTAWASELQLGSWYTLDHNNQRVQVQFAWRSERKQLNLFASTSGKSFLIQAGRLAAYLQAGLLVPQEEEALTVRATRDALAKLEANPERLLA
jgi:hypothetical protein